jgi:hypothetical protein
LKEEKPHSMGEKGPEKLWESMMMFCQYVYPFEKINISHNNQKEAA